MILYAQAETCTRMHITWYRQTHNMQHKSLTKHTQANAVPHNTISLNTMSSSKYNPHFCLDLITVVLILLLQH